VTKLLVETGSACARYQDEVMRNLPCQYLQLDEIWAFCGMKEKMVPPELRGTEGFGDVWTWTAIDAETKLVPCWHVGKRELDDAETFVGDLRGRLANRVQLTTDGLKVYVKAIKETFGQDVDFAVLAKMYGSDPHADRKYSPAVCISCTKRKIVGSPDDDHINTSFVERQNLTMRMSMRRFTRLTNAFSKKLENLKHAVALHFFHYNFIRRHQTLKMTPGEAAGLGRVWRLEELPELVDFCRGLNSN
jgi:IS1 family transposase